MYAYVILLTLVGPEYRGRNFDVAADEDMAAVTGVDQKIRNYSVDEEERRREVHV